MTDNRNYRAFKSTAVFYVREAEIEIGKIGGRGLVRKCACHSALEPFVRRFGDEQFAKGKGASKEALKAALEGALEEARRAPAATAASSPWSSSRPCRRSSST